MTKAKNIKITISISHDDLARWSKSLRNLSRLFDVNDLGDEIDLDDEVEEVSAPKTTDTKEQSEHVRCYLNEMAEAGLVHVNVRLMHRSLHRQFASVSELRAVLAEMETQGLIQPIDTNKHGQPRNYIVTLQTEQSQ